jgi:hypothetical protein
MSASQGLPVFWHLGYPIRGGEFSIRCPKIGTRLKFTPAQNWPLHGMILR